MSENNKCVVKFQSDTRKITMYFEEKDGGLDLQMVMDPEFDPEANEEPDLPMLLASTLMNALKVTEDDSTTSIYSGGKIYS